MSTTWQPTESPGSARTACNRIVESRAIGHQSSRRNHAAAVGFDDRAVHSGSKPEIIRIDD